MQIGDGNTPSKGKSACTKFTRISTNGSHSIVLCEPTTGRTHQIRVHLQYTGHPIANDMLYLSGSVVNRSTEGISADRAAAKSNLSLDKNPHENQKEETHGENHKEEPDGNSMEQFRVDPMCTHCPNLAPNWYDGSEEGLWLHCVKYSGPDWTYECAHPEWAIL